MTGMRVLKALESIFCDNMDFSHGFAELEMTEKRILKVFGSFRQAMHVLAASKAKNKTGMIL